MMGVGTGRAPQLAAGSALLAAGRFYSERGG